MRQIPIALSLVPQDSLLSDTLLSRRPTAGTVTEKAHTLPVFALSVLGCMLGNSVWAAEEPNEISECDVFIEINATDEDAGWQGILDASPWSSAQILGPDARGHRKHSDGNHSDEEDGDYDRGGHGKAFLEVEAQGKARKQGITEYRWESAEPTFEDFALEDFLERFPTGKYTCRVKFIEGHPKQAKEKDKLTHCLPDGPVITDPGGPLPADTDWNVTWSEVTTQYDQDGPGEGAPLDECEPEDELVKYSVTVELENEDGDSKVMNFDVWDPEATQAVVSGDFLECGLTGKVEIGAFVHSGNSTFREIEIATSDCP